MPGHPETLIVERDKGVVTFTMNRPSAVEQFPKPTIVTVVLSSGWSP
jgi:hypothetical protein